MPGTILHPTDLLAQSDRAFAHALRMALSHGHTLEVVHVAGAPKEGQSSEFPAVRNWLERWNLLSLKATSDDVDALGFDWTFVHLPAGMSPGEAVGNDLRRNPANVVVLHSEARQGLDRMLRPSVAEHLMRNARSPVLCLPAGTDGFVDPDTGTCELERILIPVEDPFLADLALEAMVKLLAPLAPGSVEVTLLHVGKPHEMPPVHPPELKGWRFHAKAIPGEPAEVISAVASGTYAQVVVMSTRGHDSIGDRIFGSTVQRVLRKAECAVLSVPGVV